MALFAVLTTQSPRGITADDFRRRLPQGFSYIQDLVDKGVIRHSWIRVGASGGLNIYDVESHEQLLSMLYDNPISPHLSFEVTPLAEAGSLDSTAYERSRFAEADGV